MSLCESVLELIHPDAHIFWHYISIKRDNASQPNRLSWKIQTKSESTRGHLLWATVIGKNRLSRPPIVGREVYRRQQQKLCWGLFHRGAHICPTQSLLLDGGREGHGGAGQ